MNHEQIRCPNCGSAALMYVGRQWWPMAVIQRRGWRSFCCVAAEIGQFQRGAIRLYRCDRCGDAFLEPSCFTRN